MRSLPLVLPLLFAAACHTLTNEEQDKLAMYQRNAGLYFEGAKYEQALGLVERGLAIDPDDYKLRTMQAAIHLRQSGPVAGRDQQLLDQSLAEFGEVYGWRSPLRHDRYLLLYYALARQKQGMRLAAEAATLDVHAADAADRAADLHARTATELDGAQELLATLLERGEVPRLCHYHLLQIAALRSDAAGVLTHGNHYLEVAKKEQERTEKEIDRTTVYGYEQEQKSALQALRDEEVDVRTLMAQQLFLQHDYAAALPHVDAVLKLDPTRSDEHYNRGLILRNLGRIEEAKNDLRTFLATTRLPPDSPKVTDAVQALTR